MLFNRLFAAIGANSILVPMQVPASHLRTAIAGLKAVANLDGIVVTVPHKVTITEAVEGAIRKGTWVKNFNQAMSNLVDDMKRLDSRGKAPEGAQN